MFPLLLALTGTPAAKQIPPPEAPPARPAPPAGPVEPPKPECPTWNHYFTPVGACAGPGLYPFEKQPRVCPVAVCTCDPLQKADTIACKMWEKEFSAAAFIPYPRFDDSGRCVPGDGLVIYEGMRLTVDPNTGKYDLTFTATVPQMPVSLWLQLEFIHPATHERYRLTLPPIRLQPNRDAKPGDAAAWTFHVAHRGYSTLLVFDQLRPNTFVPENGNRLVRIDHQWELKRDAIARFGTPVAIEDPNR